MEERSAESSFDRTAGLRSAKAGLGYWWMQRVTAVALVPLTLWFTASLFARARSNYGELVLWLRTPLTTVVMVLLLIALFFHMALGLRVVIEDYVHTERAKIPTVIVVQFGCFALAVAGIVATLRIAFGG